MEVKPKQFIANQPNVVPDNIDKKLRDVAQLYEKHFLREMVKAMRSSVSESELVQKGMGEKIYAEQLDNEYVEQWGGAGGVGLSELIYQNIKQKYFPDQAPHPTSQGEILPIEKKEIFKIEQAPSSVQDAKTYELDEPPSEGGKTSSYKIKLNPYVASRVVKAPSDGRIVSQFRFDDQFTQFNIEHQNGISSTLTLNGKSVIRPDQTEVSAGQDLAILSPEAKEFFWVLKNPKNYNV